MKTSGGQLKIALVHDYLVDYGGAERVVEALHELFPAAPLYTSFVDKQSLGIHWSKFKDWDIRQSQLAEIPFHRKFFSPLRIFAPYFFSQFDLTDFDVVLSSTNAYFAKAVKTRAGEIHVCYCHTPARSLYGYSTMTDWQKNPITHLVGTLLNHYLRVVDVQIAQKVDFFIANSGETQRRIATFYRRDSTIIFPPVNVPKSWADVEKLSGSQKEYFIYVNRLAFSKHPEVAVQACSELNLPLKVVGTGKMMSKLREIAGPSIEFLGPVPDAQLAQLYAGAKALLYPVGDEDFGIVPVEAMGYGIPVIAHRSGGPRETIIEGKTGVFFDDLDVDGLKVAIQKFNRQHFDKKYIFKHAQQFSKQSFQRKIRNFITRQRKTQDRKTELK